MNKNNIETYDFISYVDDTETKNQILNFIRDEYYTILKPGVHGVGVFAIKDIPKGVDPFPVFKHPLSKDGHKWFQLVVKKNELVGVHRSVIDYHSTRVFHPKDEIVITICNEMYKLQYLNHSESNNLDIGKSNLSGLVTNRDVEEGEELFQNYHHFKYWESLIDG
jgi:SET domain-containing protein